SVAGRGVQVKRQCGLEEGRIRRSQRLCNDRGIGPGILELGGEGRDRVRVAQQARQGGAETLRTEEGVFARNVIIHPEFFLTPSRRRRCSTAARSAYGSRAASRSGSAAR